VTPSGKTAIALALACIAFIGCNSAPIVDDITAGDAFEKAKRRYIEGDYGAAQVAFQTFRNGQTNPAKIAEGYYWEGMCLLAQREFADARAKLELGLKKNPEGWLRAYTLSSLGESLIGLGMFTEARKAYLEALESAGDDIRLDHVLLRLATCAQRLNQWEEAEQYLNRLLSDAPGSRFADQAKEKLQYGKKRFFTVQIGAYKEPEAARARAAELKKDGLEPFVGQIERSGETLHCVWIGKYDKWEDAILAMQRIRGQVQVEDAIVKP
jgi:tetratricopeptide (TPR) repeat protein